MYGIAFLFALVAAVLVAISRAVHALWLGPEAQARRRLRAGHPDEIRDHDIVTVTGTVIPPAAPLESPLTGKPCVAYRLTARGRVSGARYNEDVLDVSALVAFDLELATGRRVRVEGEVAALEMRPSPVIPRDLEREHALIPRCPAELDPATLSFEEARVVPGDRVRVHGIALVEAAPDGYRDAARVRITPHEHAPLTIGGA